MNDDKPTVYTGAMTEEGIQNYVQTNMLPLVSEIGPGNWQVLSATGKKLVAAVIMPSKKEYLAQLRSVATERRGDYTFGWFDGAKYSQVQIFVFFLCSRVLMESDIHLMSVTAAVVGVLTYILAYSS
jgi:hypothetical protein